MSTHVSPWPERSDTPSLGVSGSFARVVARPTDDDTNDEAVGQDPRFAEESLERARSRSESREGGGAWAVGSSRARAEAAAITIAVPCFGYALDPSDPLLLHRSFSWIALAPMLVAIRHGLTLSFASAVAIDVALVIGWRTHIFALERFPAGTFVGLIAVSMLIGRFADAYQREIVRLGAAFGVLEKRHSELSRSHFLLELSHDRLGAQAGRNVNSLRDAITAIRELTEREASPSYVVLGDAMMGVLGAYCMIEVASLHLVDGQTLGKPVAALGRPPPVDPESPLVVEALRTGRLTYVPAASRSSLVETRERSTLLAAVPFVDSAGRVHALLSVHSMPFVSFERRNLEAIATIAGRFADLVAYGDRLTDAQRGRMDAFDRALRSAISDLEERGQPSIVAFVWIRCGAKASDIVELVLGDARRDARPSYTVRDPSGNSFVYVLLPGADHAAAKLLEARLHAIAAENGHATLEALGVKLSCHLLQPTDSLRDVFRLFAGQHHAKIEVGVDGPSARRMESRARGPRRDRVGSP